MTRPLVRLSLFSLILVLVSGADRLSAQSNNVIGNSGGGKMSVIQSPKGDTSAAAEQTPVPEKSSPAPSQKTPAQDESPFYSSTESDDQTDNSRVQTAISEKKSKYITVIGQVGKPGVFEFTHELPSFEQLIGEYAGGLTSYSGREFYLFRQTPAGLKRQELEPRRDLQFQFADGDILLAETPIKYYQNLGLNDSGRSLNDLNAPTQIVLLNILDRPVLFTVKPENARLAGLLELMQQDISAMAGLVNTPPPNAKSIPAQAEMAPNTILSGTILTFQPQSIARDRLPELPPAVRVTGSENWKVASNESPIRSVEYVGEASLPKINARVREQPTQSSSQSVETASSPESSTLSEETSESPAELTTQMDDAEQFDAFQQAFQQAFQEMESSDTEMPAGEVLDLTIPANDKPNALLSSQQTTYLVSFLIIVSLFGVAWFIRERQSARMLKRYVASDQPDSETVQTSHDRQPWVAATATIEESPIDSSNSPQTETVPPEELAASHAEPTAAPENVLPEKTVEPEADVTKEEPRKVDVVEEPPATIVEDVMPAEESDVLESVSEPSRPEPMKSIPQSIMDSPLMRELLQEQARRVRHSALADQVEPPEIDAATDVPQSSSEANPYQPPVGQKLRIDQAHPTTAQPMFPISWKPTEEEADQPANLNRYNAQQPEESASSQSDRVDSQSSPVSGPHMKMRDLTNTGNYEEDAKLFDRVFRAVMRERQK
ncbi:MAG: hypothetical protein HUJ26_20955 [Planctomycetaceae bacterium]|nr:hypothetical protein [Planctomycetaceae bacterium]